MIADYINIDLLKELGLDSLPEERQQAILQKMLQVIDQRVLTYALNTLTEGEKEKLDVLLQDENSDIAGFLQSAIPNYDLVVQEIIADYKKETLDLYTGVTA